MGKSDYEYLDEERKKLWHKVNSIETALHRRIDDELSKKAADFTDEAKQASKKASEYRNRSEESRNTIVEYQESAATKLQEIQEIFSSIETLNLKIKAYSDDASSNEAVIKQFTDEISSRKDAIEANISKLEGIFADHESLEEKVATIELTFTKGEDTSARIETLYRSLLARKKEIDQLYFDIIGYTDKDDLTGAETKVSGLKDTLTTAYDEIRRNLKDTNTELKDLLESANSTYEQFSTKNELELKETIDRWNSRYLDLANKIQELLPNALTAGLSSAFSEKKDAEILESARLNKTFNIAIGGLVFVSLIPFGIGLITMSQNKPLEKVLLDMPRLVMSILPLYIPVLWVAYSSNRKMNLSKRLSEEYSHKEVLSKTFEGLSTQINNISDEKTSSDLRNKLLYNILEVSAENPGKLISDYNKSDHPLMDALDKSVKLATAFERLEKIPGFSKLAKILDKKSKAIIDEEDEKANKGLNAIDDAEQ